MIINVIVCYLLLYSRGCYSVDTVMCCLMMGICSEKWVIRRFRPCVNIRVYLQKPRSYGI